MTAALGDWRPSVADVAEIIPDRTGDIDVHAGTFDATTVPTATQVQGLIRQIQAEVVGVVGAMPSDLVVIPEGGGIGDTQPGHVVALGAAYMVELSFYPDQQLAGTSRAEMLREDYLRERGNLATAANSVDTGTDPGDPLRPTATFPALASFTQFEVF